MKFVCPHCRSMYTISDELARGRRLKIRCRKCGNIIVVTGAPKAAPRDFGPDPKGQSVDNADEPKTPSTPPRKDGFASSFRHGRTSGDDGTWNETDIERWFVGVNGEPVGPISARAVHARRRGGVIGETSLVWREGMDDWRPLRECSVLVELLEAVERERFSLPPKPSAKSDSVLADAREEPDQVQDMDGSTDEQERRGSTGNRMYLAVATGFFAVAIATLVLVVLDRGETRRESEQVRTVEKIVEKVVYRDRLVERAKGTEGVTDPSSKSSLDVESAGVLNAADKRKREKTNQRKAKADERTRELLEQFGVSTPTEGAIAIERPKTGSDEDKAQASAGLSSGQLKAVVDRNKGTLRTCYEQALRRGEAPDDRDLRANFKVAVGRSGMVERVAVGGEARGYPSLCNCLERSVKRWVFQASGGSAKVEFPFVFTPTR